MVFVLCLLRIVRVTFLAWCWKIICPWVWCDVSYRTCNLATNNNNNHNTTLFQVMVMGRDGTGFVSTVLLIVVPFLCLVLFDVSYQTCSSATNSNKHNNDPSKMFTRNAVTAGTMHAAIPRIVAFACWTLLCHILNSSSHPIKHCSLHSSYKRTLGFVIDCHLFVCFIWRNKQKP